MSDLKMFYDKLSRYSKDLETDNKMLIKLNEKLTQRLMDQEDMLKDAYKNIADLKRTCRYDEEHIEYLQDELEKKRSMSVEQKTSN